MKITIANKHRCLIFSVRILKSYKILIKEEFIPKFIKINNGTVCIRHLCMKITILSNHRCLIFSVCVIKSEKILIKEEFMPKLFKTKQWNYLYSTLMYERNYMKQPHMSNF
jgi:hypothetical protein